ncbi:helix-turn-helix domain-containing protein [Saccharothrix sp. NRRL B-16314]|uniref:helix-turn-helix domain-containing protein n=1 Tax=Saccharothrix sp. NRRL B-16314 TaxID=1463825 RepID=UPI0018CC31E8|nr:helix-turn-helix domain-containing protein [Saccharothrix sp. NRRL B-16314]
METVVLRTRLKPGRELDYEAAHRVLPDDLRDDLVQRGIVDWMIWRDGVDLVHVITVTPSFEAYRSNVPNPELGRRHRDRMSEYLDPAPASTPPPDLAARERPTGVCGESEPRTGVLSCDDNLLLRGLGRNRRTRSPLTSTSNHIERASPDRRDDGLRPADPLTPESAGAWPDGQNVVPCWFEDGRAAGPALRRTLAKAHRRGATIVGLCLGAVADAGLLSRRTAVTHWQAVDMLAARHRDVDVDASVLYIDHGDVLTSAGTASAIDACLHLVRGRLGAAAANRVARSLVVAPHREGGQAQYIERPLPAQSANDPIAAVLEWALRHLAEPLPVERLADVAHLSRRTFIRAFQASTGTTPATWIRRRRLDEARRLLESTDLPIDQVAATCGFGSTVTMRQRFTAAFDTSPSEYRRRFDARTADGSAGRHGHP